MRRHPYAMPKALRWEVFARDGGCLLAKIEPDHVCRDAWGQPHAPNDFDRLTLEHVKDQSMMGRKAPNDAAHLVTLCATSNVGVPSHAQREWFRAYLREVTRA